MRQGGKHHLPLKRERLHTRAGIRSRNVPICAPCADNANQATNLEHTASRDRSTISSRACKSMAPVHVELAHAALDRQEKCGFGPPSSCGPVSSKTKESHYLGFPLRLEPRLALRAVNIRLLKQMIASGASAPPTTPSHGIRRGGSAPSSATSRSSADSASALGDRSCRRCRCACIAPSAPHSPPCRRRASPA